jgi:hypothetical protein
VRLALFPCVCIPPLISVYLSGFGVFVASIRRGALALDMDINMDMDEPCIGDRLDDDYPP